MVPKVSDVSEVNIQFNLFFLGRGTNISYIQRGTRAKNSGVTQEPSSKKKFSFTLSLYIFEILKKSNSKMVLRFL